MSTAEGSTPQTPRVIGGFELISKLGQGGMGAVFKARQQSLDRIVALKILPKSIAKDARFIERFQREARASAKLNHPNIVQGIDVGMDGGLWFFAMELVDGPTLQQVLKEQKVLPEERALEIIRDVARALECAAAHNIVHRDIKPDNILLTSRGESKLADLGLAKHITDDASVTQSGQTVGTPNYMPPEQVRGQMADIDARSDIYALGATLFHLVTGRPPFEGATSAVIMSAHLTTPPPKANKINPEVSEACTRLIDKMLQKKREQRPQTATEVITQIERILSGETTAARTTGPRVPVRAQHSTRKHEAVGVSKKLMIGAGVGLVALVVVALLLNGKGKNDSAEKVAEVKTPPPAEKPAAPTKPVKSAAAPADNKPPKKTKNKLATEEKPVSPDTSKASTDVASIIEPVQPDSAPPTQPAAQKTPPEEIVVARKPADTEKTPAPAPDETKGAQAAPAATTPAATPANPAALTAPAATVASREWSGFLGEYFDGQNFETLNTSQTDPMIEFKWPNGAPGKSATGVSIRWTGFIEPDANGVYTFDVSADDAARLYIDDRPVFDGWSGRNRAGKSMPVTLEKGKRYALRFEMRNKAEAAEASLKWSRGAEALGSVHANLPTTENAAVPIGHLEGGWQAEYGRTDAEGTLVKRMEPFINWDWHVASPSPEVPADKFWGRWTGIVVPPETDEYSFQVQADEVARLFINDMLLIDFWGLGQGTRDSPPLKLTQGKKYLVRVEYAERGDYAHCFLRWSSSKFKDALVPAQGVGQPDDALPPDGFLAEFGHLGNSKALLTRRDIRAGWNWRSASPAPEINAEKFWARYTGWITPPADGEYTFSIDYDEGVHFYLDDIMLLDTGNRGGEGKIDLAPVALKGGKRYMMRADYWERGDYAHLDIQWRSAAMTKRPVTGLIPEAIKEDSKEVGRFDGGLIAEYGVNKPTLLKRFEGRIFHDFHGGTPGIEVPQGPTYWGKWTGGLRVAASGNYVFKLDAELEAELKLNGVSIVKLPVKTTGARAPKGVPANAAPVTSIESQPLPLNKGTTYFLEGSFTSKRGDYSYIKLLWKPPGKADFEEIPADAFLLPPQARQRPVAK